MNKSLQEIQQENRRLIMQIVHGCDFDKKAGYELDKLFEPITLSRVLLVLGQSDEYLQFNPCLGIVKTWDQKGSETDEIMLFKWDLNQETLEEQSEETQRAIYQLLNNN